MDSLTWGNSWGTSWAASWDRVFRPEVPTYPPRSFTIIGNRVSINIQAADAGVDVIEVNASFDVEG